MHACIPTYIHTYLHTLHYITLHTCIHTFIHTSIHTYIHVYMCMYVCFVMFHHDCRPAFLCTRTSSRQCCRITRHSQPFFETGTGTAHFTTQRHGLTRQQYKLLCWQGAVDMCAIVLTSSTDSWPSCTCSVSVLTCLNPAVFCKELHRRTPTAKLSGLFFRCR